MLSVAGDNGHAGGDNKRPFSTRSCVIMSQVLPIVYQDDTLIALRKPSGLLVHRTALARGETRFALQLHLSARVNDDLQALLEFFGWAGHLPSDTASYHEPV